MQRASLQRTSIPLFEPWFPHAYADAVRDQVLSGFVGPGRVTQTFMEEIAVFSSVPHCLLTVSGTMALTVAAVALGLQPGDEILVPGYGVISTINGFASIGLQPKLVDIDRRTGCMSVTKLAEMISARTKAVCFVNFSGYTGENLIEAVAECARHGVPLIEDAACALGHRHRGGTAGTFGTVGVYSFSVPKVLTTGQGGALVTRDRRVFEKAAAFIDQGDLEWRKTNLNREIGTNLRFTDIQASFGLCQIRDLSSRLERRRHSFEVLRTGLEPWLYRVPGDEAPLHNIVFTPDPEGLIDSLKQWGIQAVRQYRTISQHPAYAHLAGHPLPDSDYWTSHAVYLPFGMSLTEEDAQRIVSAVLDAGVPLDRLPA